MKCFTIPLFLLFLFISSQTAICQIPHGHEKVPKATKVNSKKISNKLYFLVRESFPLNDERKQYLINEFVDGQIIDYEGEPHEVSVRYRFLDDEMQIIHHQKIKALVQERIQKIILKHNDQFLTFIPFEYFEKKIKNIGYFQVISQGKLTLLKSYRSGKGGMKVTYFHKKFGTPAQELRMKKSSILKSFGDKKSTISKYIVQQNLNLKNEKDLIKVFDYFNSL